MNTRPKWELRKLKPDHLAVARYWLLGLNNQEIAQETGYHPYHVSRIINSPQFQDILTQLSAKTIETVNDIRADVQAMLPGVIEQKYKLALHARDERVRNIACSDILGIGGLSPIRQVHVERHEAPSQYEGKTDEQIAADIYSDLKLEQPDESKTVH